MDHTPARRPTTQMLVTIATRLKPSSDCSRAPSSPRTLSSLAATSGRIPQSASPMVVLLLLLRLPPPPPAPLRPRPNASRPTTRYPTILATASTVPTTSNRVQSSLPIRSLIAPIFGPELHSVSPTVPIKRTSAAPFRRTTRKLVITGTFYLLRSPEVASLLTEFIQ